MRQVSRESTRRKRWISHRPGAATTQFRAWPPLTDAPQLIAAQPAPTASRAAGSRQRAASRPRPRGSCAAARVTSSPPAEPEPRPAAPAGPRASPLAAHLGLRRGSPGAGRNPEEGAGGLLLPLLGPPAASYLGRPPPRSRPAPALSPPPSPRDCGPGRARPPLLPAAPPGDIPRPGTGARRRALVPPAPAGGGRNSAGISPGGDLGARAARSPSPGRAPEGRGGQPQRRGHEEPRFTDGASPAFVLEIGFPPRPALCSPGGLTPRSSASARADNDGKTIVLTKGTERKRCAPAFRDALSGPLGGRHPGVTPGRRHPAAPSHGAAPPAQPGRVGPSSPHLAAG